MLIESELRDEKDTLLSAPTLPFAKCFMRATRKVNKLQCLVEFVYN